LQTPDFSQAGQADPPDDPAVIELDMDAVYQAAARATKHWRLEYISDGAPFVWHGKAKSQAAAEIKARRELADFHAGFCRFGARLLTATSEVLS
jgi:hypothetical protein